MAMSDEHAQVTRSMESDLAPEELWELVAGEWASWMVDEADVAVEPGATGTVVDDGIERVVRIDRVEPSERVAFTWWPASDPANASSVDLVVLPRRHGSALHVTERFPVQASAGRAMAWDVRVVLLAVAGRVTSAVG
jgi:uncharacterized protein YndB with AHSA1/START domain